MTAKQSKNFLLLFTAAVIWGVASSKPDGMVKRILEHFELSEYFHEIVGSDPEKMKMSKADVIEIILERLGYRDRRG